MTVTSSPRPGRFMTLTEIDTRLDWLRRYGERSSARWVDEVDRLLDARLMAVITDGSDKER